MRAAHSATRLDSAWSSQRPRNGVVKAQVSASTSSMRAKANCDSTSSGSCANRFVMARCSLTRVAASVMPATSTSSRSVAAPMRTASALKNLETSVSTTAPSTASFPPGKAR